MLSKPAIEEREHNSEHNTDDIRDPVVYVGTTVEAGLDEFNGATEG